MKYHCEQWAERKKANDEQHTKEDCEEFQINGLFALSLTTLGNLDSQAINTILDSLTVGDVGTQENGIKANWMTVLRRKSAGGLYRR